MIRVGASQAEAKEEKAKAKEKDTAVTAQSNTLPSELYRLGHAQSATLKTIGAAAWNVALALPRLLARWLTGTGKLPLIHPLCKKVQTGSKQVVVLVEEKEEVKEVQGKAKAQHLRLWTRPNGRYLQRSPS